MHIPRRSCLLVALLLAGAGAVMAGDAPVVKPVRTGTFPFWEYASRYDIWKFIPMDQAGRLKSAAIDSALRSRCLRLGRFKPLF
jgi:hypothetical protein